MNHFISLSLDDYADPSRLDGRFEGQPCFIVGASQSNNELDLSLMDGFCTYGINWTLRAFKPTFLQVIDTLVLNTEKKRILSNADTVYLIRERLTQFMPFPALKLKYKTPLTHTEMVPPKSVNSVFTSSSNSAFLAVCVAYVMGFDPIVMIGVDMNIKWRGNDKQKPAERVSGSHFSEDIPAGSKGIGFNASKQAMFFGYLVKNAFENTGRRLWNCSPLVNPEFNVIPRRRFDKVCAELREAHASR